VGSPGLGFGEGRAYVFVRSGTSWNLQATLLADDVGTTDLFGEAVSLDGDTALVSASWIDSAYVLVRSGADWTQEAHFTAPGLGGSVAVDGDTALVGAPGELPAGAVHVFVRSGTSWTEQAVLTAGGAVAGARFGHSVSLNGDTALIGAERDEAGGIDSGSAYVFLRSGASWTEEAKLTAPDGAAGDQFGYSVSLDGDMALVGIRGDNLSPGYAYLFARNETTWTEKGKLEPGDGEAGDQFGTAVSLSGVAALLGASGDGAFVGSAYVFTLVPPSAYCTAGISASGCQAAIASAGFPSASAPAGFTLLASGVEGAKDGLFFFGTGGQQANPWGNGTSFQCVVPPVVRAGLLAGSGTVGACDGSFAQDLNALWCPTCPKPQKNPGVCATVQAQLWYRDPQSTSNQPTSLSDALEFVVGL
jgi:hypothetical protein